MNTRTFTVGILAATTALALTACGGEDDVTGDYHGFATEADYNSAITDHACDLAEGNKNTSTVIKVINENPDFAHKYDINGAPDSAALLRKMFVDTRTGGSAYDCSNTMVREATILDIEQRGYFDRDYAIEEGVIDE